MQSNVYVLRPKTGLTGSIVADAAVTASEAAQALMALQQVDGHLVFELEADATIPSARSRSSTMRRPTSGPA